MQCALALSSLRLALPPRLATQEPNGSAAGSASVPAAAPLFATPTSPAVGPPPRVVRRKCERECGLALSTPACAGAGAGRGEATGVKDKQRFGATAVYVQKTNTLGTVLWTFATDRSVSQAVLEGLHQSQTDAQQLRIHLHLHLHLRAVHAPHPTGTFRHASFALRQRSWPHGAAGADGSAGMPRSRAARRGAASPCPPAQSQTRTCSWRAGSQGGSWWTRRTRSRPGPSRLSNAGAPRTASCSR